GAAETGQAGDDDLPVADVSGDGVHSAMVSAGPVHHAQRATSGISGIDPGGSGMAAESQSDPVRGSRPDDFGAPSATRGSDSWWRPGAGRRPPAPAGHAAVVVLSPRWRPSLPGRGGWSR